MKGTIASRHSQYTDIFRKSKENTHFTVFFGISSDSPLLSASRVMVIPFIMLFYTIESVEKVHFSSRPHILSGSCTGTTQVRIVILYGDLGNLS